MFKRLASIFFGIVLLNAVPAALSVFYGYDRALISLESILIACLFAFGYMRLAYLWGWLILLLEAAIAFTKIYPLFNVKNAMVALQFVGFANKAYIAMAAAGLIAYVACILVAARLCSRHGASKQLALIVLLTGLFANIPAMTNFDKSSHKILTPLNQSFFGSAGYDFFDEWRAAGSTRVTIADDENFRPIHTISARAMTEFEMQPAQKILYVVVESWGVPVNRTEFLVQTDAFRVRDKFTVLKEGQVEYRGGTVAGELRELCGLSPISYAVMHVPEPFSANCLPRLFGLQGYKTASLHSANSGMYARFSWYPDVGFEDSYFLDRPMKNVAQCYSFPGYCDVDLIPSVMEYIGRQDRVFFYWMTLNSHAPYDKRDLKKLSEDLCPQYSIQHGERCRSFLLLKEFFDELASGVSLGHFAGLEIVLVGDHKPPFFGGDYSREFLPNVVPYMHLRLN